jgi:hypothetical protein
MQAMAILALDTVVESGSGRWVYGIVKIVTTSIFIAVGVERFGRRKPLLIGVLLMSMFLWIHSPRDRSSSLSDQSIGR